MVSKRNKQASKSLAGVILVSTSVGIAAIFTHSIELALASFISGIAGFVTWAVIFSI